MSEPKKPRVKLTGADGNVFSIIGLCQRAFRKAGMVEEGHAFVKEAFAAGSYDAVLQLAMTRLDVR